MRHGARDAVAEGDFLFVDPLEKAQEHFESDVVVTEFSNRVGAVTENVEVVVRREGRAVGVAPGLGIEVDAEHLALEVIDAVGPGGNFMTSPHTMTHMRSEYYYGNGVTDRKSRDKWEQDGSLDIRQRALEMAKKLLSNPEPSYIPEAVDKAIKDEFHILLQP